MIPTSVPIEETKKREQLHWVQARCRMHIEKHKGVDSMYLLDIQKAYKDSIRDYESRNPGSKVTSSQLSNSIGRWTKEDWNISGATISVWNGPLGSSTKSKLF